MEQKIDKAARAYSHDINTTFGPRIPALTDAFKAGAAYALSSQWRSVEEELPPYQTDILGAENGSVYMCRRWAMSDGEDEYIICDAESFHPTHWMPIPALPQERKEGEW